MYYVCMYLCIMYVLMMYVCYRVLFNKVDVTIRTLEVIYSLHISSGGKGGELGRFSAGTPAASDTAMVADGEGFGMKYHDDGCGCGAKEEDDEDGGIIIIIG